MQAITIGTTCASTCSSACESTTNAGERHAAGAAIAARMDAAFEAPAPAVAPLAAIFVAADPVAATEIGPDDGWQAAIVDGAGVALDARGGVTRSAVRARCAGDSRGIGGFDAGRDATSPIPARAAGSKAIAGLRSRAERDGFEGLGAAELLRLLCAELEPGHAERLLEAQDLAHWSRASVQQLAVEAGLRLPSAVSLGAAFALGRLVEGEALPERARLNSPGLVHRLMAPRMRGLPVETLHVLLLDGKHRLRRVVRVSEGTLTNAMVHPREVYAPALREGAAALIAVHNHPSGDPEPSEDDVRVTRRLIDTGTLVGVPLLDHVVVAGNGWVSLRERLRWDP